MARTEVSRSIKAPVARVFDTIAHIENFSKAVPHITDVEILSEQTSGVGTRFAETRVMRGRQATTTIEVTEYVENERIRMVSDEGGTVWDTVFTLSEERTSGGDTASTGTRLEMVMDARPYKLSAKLFNPLMKGIIRKAIKGDMDAIKAFCEAAED